MTALPARARGDLAVALVALVALAGWELSGLDLTVSAWFGSANGFAARDAWWASTLAHQGGRLAAWLLLAVIALDALRPLWPQRPGPPRRERRFWLAVTVACLLLVPALKRASGSSCPWDLAPFGGAAAYVPHWRLGAFDGGPGHCFPSGHAVAAFGFFGGYFLWRSHRPVAARRWLLGVCAAGVLFGAAQVLRGAHFVSHVLWAAWLCWGVCGVADVIVRSRAAGRLAAAGRTTTFFLAREP